MFRHFYKRLEPFFAVVGVIAAIIAIYQGYLEFIAQTKSIEATYRVSTLAEDASVFDVKAVLQNDLATYKRIVAFDVLVWNSGRDVISESDVRTPISIQFDKSAKILEMRIGSERTGGTNNVQFKEAGVNTYRLSWNYLDPNDYFEAHFLVATSEDKASLDHVIKMQGAVVKGASLKVTIFKSRESLRDTTALVLAAVISVLGLIAFVRLLDLDTKKHILIKPSWPGWIVFPMIIIVPLMGFSIPIALGALIGPWVSSIWFRVPLWAEAHFFPPYFYAQLIW